jgi:hypothetical protein
MLPESLLSFVNANSRKSNTKIEYLLHFALANSGTQQRNSPLSSVNANSRKSNTKIEYLLQFALANWSTQKGNSAIVRQCEPVQINHPRKSPYLARFDMLCRGPRSGPRLLSVTGSRFEVRSPADLMFWLHLSLFHYTLPYRLVISRLPCLATTFSRSAVIICLITTTQLPRHAAISHLAVATSSYVLSCSVGAHFCFIPHHLLTHYKADSTLQVPLIIRLDVYP